MTIWKRSNDRIVNILELENFFKEEEDKIAIDNKSKDRKIVIKLQRFLVFLKMEERKIEIFVPCDYW